MWYWVYVLHINFNGSDQTTVACNCLFPSVLTHCDKICRPSPSPQSSDNCLQNVTPELQAGTTCIFWNLQSCTHAGLKVKTLKSTKTIRSLLWCLLPCHMPLPSSSISLLGFSSTWTVSQQKVKEMTPFKSFFPFHFPPHSHKDGHFPSSSHSLYTCTYTKTRQASSCHQQHLDSFVFSVSFSVNKKSLSPNFSHMDQTQL